MNCESFPFIKTGTLAANEVGKAFDLRTPENLGYAATGGYVKNTGFNPLTVRLFALDNNELTLDLLPGEEKPTPFSYAIAQFSGGEEGATSYRLVAR